MGWEGPHKHPWMLGTEHLDQKLEGAPLGHTVEIRLSTWLYPKQLSSYGFLIIFHIILYLQKSKENPCFYRAYVPVVSQLTFYKHGFDNLETFEENESTRSCTEVFPTVSLESVLMTSP